MNGPSQYEEKVEENDLAWSVRLKRCTKCIYIYGRRTEKGSRKKKKIVVRFDTCQASLLEFITCKGGIYK